MGPLPARFGFATKAGLAMMVKARSWRGARLRACEAGVLLACAAMLGGCASTIADNVPTFAGGLPAGTPARSVTPAAFPAVHDRSITRADTVLSEQEQKWLEGDLVRERERAAADAKAAAEAEAAASKPSQ